VLAIGNYGGPDKPHENAQIESHATAKADNHHPTLHLSTRARGTIGIRNLPNLLKEQNPEMWLVS
jgi:hypothetical protein